MLSKAPAMRERGCVFTQDALPSKVRSEWTAWRTYSPPIYPVPLIRMRPDPSSLRMSSRQNEMVDVAKRSIPAQTSPSGTAHTISEYAPQHACVRSVRKFGAGQTVPLLPSETWSIVDILALSPFLSMRPNVQTRPRSIRRRQCPHLRVDYVNKNQKPLLPALLNAHCDQAVARNRTKRDGKKACRHAAGRVSRTCCMYNNKAQKRRNKNLIKAKRRQSTNTRDFSPRSCVMHAAYRVLQGTVSLVVALVFELQVRPTKHAATWAVVQKQWFRISVQVTPLSSEVLWTRGSPKAWRKI